MRQISKSIKRFIPICFKVRFERMSVFSVNDEKNICELDVFIEKSKALENFFSKA